MNKKVLLKTLGLSFTFAWTLATLSLAIPLPSRVGAVIEERDLKETRAETRPSSSAETEPATQPSAQKDAVQTEEKGGIYKVGRAFKKAGRGIKKGFVATGNAFKKAGRSIKGAFVGEKTSDDSKSSPDSKSKSSSSLDHRGDEAETQPVL